MREMRGDDHAAAPVLQVAQFEEFEQVVVQDAAQKQALEVDGGVV
jgi:hypothetical protein